MNNDLLLFWKFLNNIYSSNLNTLINIINDNTDLTRIGSNNNKNIDNIKSINYH